MKRAIIISKWIFSILLLSVIALSLSSFKKGTDPVEDNPGIAVLLVDTDRKMGDIKEAVYGQFLEHINHSVVDGLYAEQVRGQGFEDKDFETYWNPFADKGEVKVADIKFENGEKSLQFSANGGTVGVRQNRFYLQEGYEYNGSVWIKPVEGSVQLKIKVLGSDGKIIAELPLVTSGSAWQEVAYSFANLKTDKQALIEIIATGTGTVYLDFISMMRADLRKSGKMRPDLVQSLKNLKPVFIRWPGGSFASIYKWKDGIGTQVSRKFHPNTIWGGYSDYYGFGIDEFMELCRQLNTEPMIVLSATNTDPQQFQDAMDWVHYLIDPPTTQWGARRAANGHTEPYHIPYFQVDNEPMNHGLTPDQYAKIVNMYGSKLREIAPNSRIVACGQKRSNDMNWSEKLIDIA